jgi:hypothetical protein
MVRGEAVWGQDAIGVRKILVKRNGSVAWSAYNAVTAAGYQRVTEIHEHSVVVDDDDLLLGDRARERQPMLRIRRAIARQNPVRLAVVPDLRLGHHADAHDLREGLVDVDLFAVRDARDPDPDGQFLPEGHDDVVIGGYCHNTAVISRAT